MCLQVIAVLIFLLGCSHLIIRDDDRDDNCSKKDGKHRGKGRHSVLSVQSSYTESRFSELWPGPALSPDLFPLLPAQHPARIRPLS